jgi:hypothetical protein
MVAGEQRSGGAVVIGAATLLFVASFGLPVGAGATELPPALREAVSSDPVLATLLAEHTLQRSVVSSGRVLDRELHEFLLNRPDVGAALARLQGLGPYRVRQVGPRVFEGTDGEGAFSVLRILDEAPGLRVFHARGRAVLRFLPDVSGEALVLLETRYEDADGVDLAHGRLTVYARLDNRFLDRMLRLLIPVIGWVLDRKITKAFLSESRAVELLARDPEKVLARLEDEEPTLGAEVAAFRTLLYRALARRPAWAAAGRQAQPLVRGGFTPTPPPVETASETP